MDFQISGRHNGGHSESRGRGAKRLQSFWTKQKKGLKSMDDLHGAIENGDLQWIYPLKMVIFHSYSRYIYLIGGLEHEFYFSIYWE